MSALALQRRASFEDLAAPIPPGFRLQSGDVLPDREIRLRRFGNGDGPQVIVLGGISSGRDVCGEHGWWRDTIVEHEAFDLRAFGVIGLDFAPLGDVRVRLSPHDQARLILLALDWLSLLKAHAVVGASYGGMIALALAALAPERVERACVIAAAHRPSAQALAWRGVQRRMVEYGARHGDAAGGLALARQLAMITYRSAAEFEARFGVGVGLDGRGDVDKYLEGRGAAYGAAPQRWLSLSEAIDRAHVAPEDVRVATTLVACAEDQLAPLDLAQGLASRLPALQRFEIFHSIYGHDAFLKEPALIAAIIRECVQ